MNYAPWDIDEVSLIERERVGIGFHEATLFFAHALRQSRKPPAFPFHLPVLRSDDLQYEYVVIVPMRRETSAMRRRQITIGLEAMTNLCLQHPAQLPELW